ncbi:MAG: glycosyltransferase family 39 protein [Pseudomonadota bacterium]
MTRTCPPLAVRAPWRRALRHPLVAVALAVYVFAWFGTLEYRELFVPDEGRYAEIPREMAAGGDWVVPHLNGLPYLEKPPLQYWTSAVIFKALGEDEWSARLWPALTGFLGVLAVFFAGSRLFGRRAGVLAALLAASTLEYVVLSQVLTLDMGLTFFLSAAVFCLLLAQREAIDDRRRHAWMFGAWAMMGLAVLSKGLIGVVLPALALAAYVAVERDASVLRRLHWRSGLAVLVALTVPWFVAMQVRVPEFFDFFFVREHLQRYTMPAHHRPGPWYYFVVMFAVGALPWTLPYLRAWRQGLARAAVDGRSFDSGRFLALYALVVLIFFSLSQSKLPAYILPMFPALALLGGRELATRGAGATRDAVASLAVFAGLLAVLAAVLPAGASFAEEAPYLAQYWPWVFAAAALAGVAALAAQRRFRARHRLRAVALVAAGAFGAQLLLVNGAQVFAERFSTEQLVLDAESRWGALDDTAPFYSVELYDQTLPMHLGRTLTLVAWRDELDEGLRLHPAGGLPDLDAFRRAWLEARQAYAVMRPERFAAERAAGLPMTELARDARYVIVARSEILHAAAPRRRTVW